MVILLFFWLSSPEMAEMRVAQRVASGGNIPIDIIHRRYWAGLRNLFDIFVPIVDRWSLYDNTKELSPIVERNNIVNAPLFTKIHASCQNKKK